MIYAVGSTRTRVAAMVVIRAEMRVAAGQGVARTKLTAETDAATVVRHAIVRAVRARHAIEAVTAVVETESSLAIPRNAVAATNPRRSGFSSGQASVARYDQ
jgi:hypothetical protein